jgi:hypothetical protein
MLFRSILQLENDVSFCEWRYHGESAPPSADQDLSAGPEPTNPATRRQHLCARSRFNTDNS